MGGENLASSLALVGDCSSLPPSLSLSLALSLSHSNGCAVWGNESPAPLKKCTMPCDTDTGSFWWVSSIHLLFLTQASSPWSLISTGLILSLHSQTPISLFCSSIKTSERSLQVSGMGFLHRLGHAPPPHPFFLQDAWKCHQDFPTGQKAVMQLVPSLSLLHAWPSGSLSQHDPVIHQEVLSWIIWDRHTPRQQTHNIVFYYTLSGYNVFILCFVC